MSYHRALMLTHRRSSGRDGGPASSWTRSPSVWTLGGAEAPARRLRAALLSHPQGPMVSVGLFAGMIDFRQPHAHICRRFPGL